MSTTVIGMAASTLLSGFIHIQPGNTRLKAFFIYNFTRHLRWPDNSGISFNIGVVDDELMETSLKQVLLNKTNNHHRFEVISVHTPEQAENCRLIFIPEIHNYRLKEFVRYFQSGHVLIVTEGKGMTQKGAAISLIEQNNRVSFEINDSILKRNRIKVTNELLHLGRSTL